MRLTALVVAAIGDSLTQKYKVPSFECTCGVWYSTTIDSEKCSVNRHPWIQELHRQLDREEGEAT